MTYTLNLGRSLSACPSCWQNFIRDYNEKWDLHPENRSQGTSTKHFDDVNVELQEKWNAMLTGEEWGSCNEGIVFRTEQDKLWFIMRWS